MGRERSTRQSLRRIRTMTALLLLALVASGCTSFNGGGYLRSANLWAPATEKATFGINGKCKAGQFNLGPPLGVVQGAGLFDGQFEYHDDAKKIGGVGVRFHGRVAADATTSPIVLVGFTCQEVKQFFAGDLGGVAEFQGKYRPQYRTLAKQTGTFTGQISDLGEPGVQAGDTFSISLQGGAFSGYTNAGPLEGGNLQVS